MMRGIGVDDTSTAIVWYYYYYYCYCGLRTAALRAAGGDEFMFTSLPAKKMRRI
jgi:hypothetical protein